MTQPGDLPQLSGDLFLTDGGLETDLIFHRGIDLPEFASFVLLGDADAEEVLRDYFRDYLRIGSAFGHGLVLETPTWRASTSWGERLGYDPVRLRDVNRQAADLLLALRDESPGTTVVVSGCIGPAGDAYSDLGSMDEAAAEEYHAPQVEALSTAGVDLVSALTLTNVAEAIGVVRAAEARQVPVVISFTVETDGRLPTGMSLGDAVAAVDDATGSVTAYYMVNCAHHDHFAGVLDSDHPALERLRGARGNASRQSHRELDESEELDDGDPVEFGQQYAALARRFPRMNVLGGCCGSDQRHIEHIARAAG
jgi:S-methylmethionine-dependent homocysteine/selenocysteine methylase